MTRERAIEVLKAWDLNWSDEFTANEFEQAFDMAISALSDYDKMQKISLDLAFENDELMNKSRWIPVSERLPEDDDYRPCTNHEWNDGAVLYCTDKGIVGLGWYYHSTKCWANLDDRWIEQDGRVIAWMPLPEPYKKGGE